jgi:hypothetical protein
MATFWQTLALYTEHLAPVAGSILHSTSRTAAAIHNAECEARVLQADVAFLNQVPVLEPEPDYDGI